MPTREAPVAVQLRLFEAGDQLAEHRAAVAALPPEVRDHLDLIPKRMFQKSAASWRNPLRPPPPTPYSALRYDVAACRWRRQLNAAGAAFVAAFLAKSKGKPWRLVKRCCPVAWAAYFDRRAPQRGLREDAIAVVFLAVIRAAAGFDPAAGYTFPTYAGTVMRNELNEFHAANPPLAPLPNADRVAAGVGGLS